jgi:hypothetical protein
MKTEKTKPLPAGKKRPAVYLFDIMLTFGAIGFMYWLVPHFVQNILFDIVLRNMIIFLPWVGLAYLGLRLHRGTYRSKRRIIAGMTSLLIFSLVWDISIVFSRSYMTYNAFGAYKKRAQLVEVLPETVRFTPLQNACIDLGNAISTSSEHVDCDNVQSIVNGGKRFGYVAPITPSGFLQTFMKKNPGFMVLDDSTEASTDPKRRIKRIDEPQAIGPDMEWFDNLDRALAMTDFFANYEKPHYLALEPTHPEKLTAVVAKIKYAYFFQLPYWAGVVLVHPDGTIEDLSKEAALKDPRLKGQWLYPVALERKYVDLQDYAVGYGIASPFVRVPGKLEIEELPGDNKFPFLIEGSDGSPYLVTATKGEGSARGLFRMYFRNAYTGEGSYHEFKPDEVVYGASAALDRVTNIPGYSWYHENDKSSSGNMIAVEPVYIMKPGETMLHWKFTVTNREYAGISATIVSDGAKPDDIKIFRTREEFEAWKNGNTVAATKTEVSRDDKIKVLVETLSTKLEELRKLIQ